MKITPKHSLRNQVPKFVQENNPLFLKFFEYYYEYLENAKIQEVIQEIRKYGDIDSVAEEFLYTFFEELKLLPQKIASDNRLVAKHIFDLYKAKGSEEAMKLLFRIVFGEEINITYPRERMLIPSSGKWNQDYIFTTSKKEGEIKQTSNKILFSNSNGSFDFPIKSFENEIETGKCRFFFEPKRKFDFVENQEVRVYTNDTLDYIGKVVKTNPTNLKIVDSGKYWQVGQVFRIPGTIRDTICQVKSVTAGGGLGVVDIIQYGYGHLNSQNIILSPLSYKPTESYSELYYTINSLGGKDYTLSIFDTINYIAENILGYSYDQKYVLEAYVLRGYIKRLSIKNTDLFIDSTLQHVNQSVTHQQWLESLTKIEIQDSFLGKCRGFYEDHQGHLSDEYIRIQDGKFYQLFSYVIETQQSISDYEKIHSLFHPSGINNFCDMTMRNDFDFSPTVERVSMTDTIVLKDTIGTTDNISFV